MLHFLRIKGRAGEEALACASGLAAAEVSSALSGLREAGTVRLHERPLPMWSLTPEARGAYDEQLAEARAGAAWCAPVLSAYDEFKPVNAQALNVFYDWQMRGPRSAPVLNDHSDPAYDARVIHELRRVDERARPLLDRVDALLPIFSRYPARLSAALSRVAAGEHEWFTRPLIDSYHTVWFELHQDLLLTLGIPRSQEDSSGERG